jgi:hypothetical protein
MTLSRDVSRLKHSSGYFQTVYVTVLLHVVLMKIILDNASQVNGILRNAILLNIVSAPGQSPVCHSFFIILIVIWPMSFCLMQ